MTIHVRKIACRESERFQDAQYLRRLYLRRSVDPYFRAPILVLQLIMF